MIDIVYPKKNREIFSGRTYFLNLLDKNLEKIKENKGKNIALLGKRFIGKSTILKEFIAKAKDTSCVYLDFEKTAMSPERFTVEFIGQICFWHLGKKYDEFANFLDIETLKNIKNELKSEGAAKIIDEVDNELGKIKTDQNLLITKAFSFPQMLSKETGKKIVICIKEFEELLSLENYEGIKDILALFEQNRGSINYIVTSSEINPVKEKFEKIFNLEEIGYMSKEEVAELLAKAKKKADINQIYKLAKGNPLYSLSIAEGDVEKRFIQESLTKKGTIYNSCKEIFYDSLNRARGKTLLTIIMKVLAKEDGMRLSEISRKLYRASPITKNLLSRLMDVDLIKLDNKKFSITDPILRYWIKNTFNGIEFENEIDEKILNELVKEIE